MKLGVDARMMFGAWQHRGIGKYILSLLKEVDSDKVVAFLPSGQSIDTYTYVSEGNGFFAWWEQNVLPKLAKEANLTHLLCPAITAPLQQIPGTKKIVVIYDLIFMQSFKDLPPSHSFYNNLGRIYRRMVAPRAYRSADTLISISEYSRDELCSRFNIPREKIHVIPCSIHNDWFVTAPAPAAEREPYLLTVTGDAPSKNLLRMFTAFAAAVNTKETSHFKLRIVGVAKSSQPYWTEKAKALNLGDKIIFEKFVSDQDLKILYRKAWASLTLSLYEGFGIPVVEAMASGTPVVCSNTTSLPEVASTAAIYADPRNVESMSEALLKIMKATAQERDALAATGLVSAQRFSEHTVKTAIADFWSGIKV